MFSDPLFLVTAIAAVLLVGLAKGGFSGIGMAATPLLALTMPPLQALAILLPILMMQDAISVWWYRHDWDGWNVKVMLPGAVVGVCLAWALASVVPDSIVRLLIGTLGVVFVLNVWFGKMPPPRRPSIAGGVFWGAGAGFTSTLLANATSRGASCWNGMGIPGETAPGRRAGVFGSPTGRQDRSVGLRTSWMKRGSTWVSHSTMSSASPCATSATRTVRSVATA